MARVSPLHSEFLALAIICKDTKIKDVKPRTKRLAMNKRAFIGLLIVATIIIGGVYLLHRPTSNPVMTQVTIDQAAKTLLYLPLYVAVDQGYLRNQGIEVNIITAGGDSQAFAALASNQAQFAQGDPTFVAISHERGGPGIVIASVLDRVAFWGVTFDKSISLFSDPKGFQGLTVVTYPEPNTAYVVQKDLITKSGLQLGRNTQIVQATFGTELGPLKSGAAQVAMSIEPTVSQALAQGAHIVFSYPDAWGPFLLTGLMTTEDFARKNPQTVQGVVNAYEEALQLIRRDPNTAVSIGQKYFPEVAPDVIRAAVQRLTAENVFPEHAHVNIASWEAALKLRVEVGDLKSADYDQLVQNSFADRASGQ
jgi:NitT/TauT family transport system substrate-binding protein